ncbi:MAG: glycine--tRNA ligase subunit beta [Deltaproteobacteria bacterium]|nr:glycine--tRNA ligase subunit beta [Deltaproteobacteria bacterium]
MEFLLEVGCEEIPARFMPPALDQLLRLFSRELDDRHLSVEETRIESFGTPRRLALVASGLPHRQPDREEEFLGPKVELAFDRDDRPTRAGLGFARSRGVEIEDLQRVQTAKGEVVAVRRTTPGRPTSEILGSAVVSVLAGLAFPKTMRWGEGEHLFARPVHWLLGLLDGELLEFEFAGVRSGRSSRGHRFSHPESFEVASVKEYFEELQKRDVWIDPRARREKLVAEAQHLAEEAGGQLLVDTALEEEVAHLVECPVAVRGHFDDQYLALPRNVLIAAMRNHQRYFAIENSQGSLLNGFVAIGNSPTADPQVVCHGNERVLSARLEDARFFFKADQECAPIDRVPKLEEMIFQADLGSYYEKAVRMASLSAGLAYQLGLGAWDGLERVVEAISVRIDEVEKPTERFTWKVARAALLSKTDLLTEMVGEFPELQGEMGGIYAELAGEEEPITTAVKEHYKPRYRGDELPASDEACVLSLADRLDTLVGCFGVGLRPTGSADPYALRRQCLGAIAIILGRGYRLSLEASIEKAIALAYDKVEASLLKKAEIKARRAAARKGKEPVLPVEVEPFQDALVVDLVEFFKGRLRQWLAENLPADVVDAVLAAGMDDMTEASRRAEALAAFARQPAFADLAVAFKRVANIIKDFGGAEVDESLLSESAERELHEVFKKTAPRFEELVSGSRYEQALGLLASELRKPVDTFFDQVLVNDPDDLPRQENRKALLQELYGLFGRMADFTRLQTKDGV